MSNNGGLPVGKKPKPKWSKASNQPKQSKKPKPGSRRWGLPILNPNLDPYPYSPSMRMLVTHSFQFSTSIHQFALESFKQAHM